LTARRGRHVGSCRCDRAIDRPGERLHLVTASQGARYQVRNNRGGVNGWVRRPAIATIKQQVLATL
jgi:hypothetical protein